MDWLKDLLEKLFSICPRITCIQPDEGGVRVTLGKYVKTLAPGWYVYWPCVQDITFLTVTPQIADLRGQSVMSSDKDFLVSFAVQYKVTDARKFILDVQDADRSLRVLGLGIIAKFAREHDLIDPTSSEKLIEEILKGIRAEAAGWGVKIMQVYQTDIGNVNNVRLVGGIPLGVTDEI